MKVRYSPKGKYFTEVVSKLPTPAIIQTARERIFGTVHLSPDHRLIDELNQPDAFLAVTDARIVGPDGEMQSEFLAVNKSQVLWILPDENAEGSPSE